MAFAIFSIGMLPQKFLSYAYWALLVEVNWFVFHPTLYLRYTDINKNICFFFSFFFSGEQEKEENKHSTAISFFLDGLR